MEQIPGFERGATGKPQIGLDDASVYAYGNLVRGTERLILDLFKLRIGVGIAITALAGWAAASGSVLSGFQVVVLGLSVLLASASAGAFNQYVKALVGELGPDAAVATAPSAQKVVQGLLSQLIRVANQAAAK